MKKKMIISLMLLLVTSSARAEWTNDKEAIYYSNVTITDISDGQIDGYSYFCIKVKNQSDVTMCAGNNKGSIWGASYETLYKQALYFYSTGQKIRVYARNDIWKYGLFVGFYGGKYLTGMSTCNSTGDCFGPVIK
ncbi:subtilase family AB5 toxin binding subunit [Citrobacter meridianamericanus]|uniref:Subtilase family AB5 toxin binding subunit n=1 Tax=Citrobacter meridianamericanus TaxID=2894201 RepID=A0ABT1BGH9_9ENTR|nr:subtilase family AB5 toxin binding subunit [Citrobacter meridianamericanus]MCO5784536.1 subtilase family AB5 toxin binding subunit [Citrobacter meridianamericanus]